MILASGKPKLNALARSLGWTSLTTMSGLFGVGVYGLVTMFSLSNKWDGRKLLLGGSLLLFTATLAAAVAVDLYFGPQTRKAGPGVPEIAYLCGFVIVLLSMVVYVIIYLSRPDDVDLAAIEAFQMCVVASTLIYAVCFKAVTFSKT